MRVIGYCDAETPSQTRYTRTVEITHIGDRTRVPDRVHLAHINVDAEVARLYEAA